MRVCEDRQGTANADRCRREQRDDHRGAQPINAFTAAVLSDPVPKHHVLYEQRAVGERERKAERRTGDTHVGQDDLPLRKRTPIWAADTLRDLCFALAGELALLPVEINHRMELRRVLRHPDLLADCQILRIEMKRLLPLHDRVRLRAACEEFRAEPHPRVNQCMLGLAEMVGDILRIEFDLLDFAINQPLDRVNIRRVLDSEATELPIPDDPHFIEEEAVRDQFVVVDRRERVVAINDGRVDRTRFFRPRAGGFRALIVYGDGDEAEILAGVTLNELLPPGQLLPAASPTRPEEKERFRTAHRSGAEFAPVELW